MNFDLLEIGDRTLYDVAIWKWFIFEWQVTSGSREHEKSRVGELLLTCVKSGRNGVLEHIGDRIMEKRKLIDWKVSSILHNIVEQ